MKSFIPVFLALLVFLSGCEPEVARVEATPTPTTAQAAKPVIGVSNGAKHIVCPQCAGEKFVMVRSSGKGTDFRQSCPICSGRGARDLVVPTNKKICQDCKGMGLLVDVNKTAKSSIGNVTLSSGSAFGNKTTCARCTGTGLVIGKSE